MHTHMQTPMHMCRRVHAHVHISTRICVQAYAYVREERVPLGALHILRKVRCPRHPAATPCPHPTLTFSYQMTIFLKKAKQFDVFIRRT